jgi:hypothetical protein
MSTVTPIAADGSGLPAGVTYDASLGLITYRGRQVPAQSYEGAQAVVRAIDTRIPIVYQDYSKDIGAVTRSFDPVTNSRGVGPANFTTVVTQPRPGNPAQGPVDNPVNQAPPSPPAAVSATNLAPNDTSTGFVFDPNTGELLPSDSVQAREILAEQQRVQAQVAVPGVFSVTFDPEGTAPNNFAVWDNSRGVVVQSGLTESEAQRRANEFNAGAADLEVSGAERVQQAQDAAEAAADAAATRERARVQATLANQLRQADSGDWRFKIRLAPGANYLYRGDDGQGVQSGILAPLAVTDGVIFPYTPNITTSYIAKYAEQDLPHSNYRGYFYSGSYPEALQVQAVFTAQDTAEANYLLAVIHFFRSVTKMFYGQNDAFRGAPPPLVFLQGFGAYQYSRHPCVVTRFNLNLPADVDYIRADVQPITGLNIQQGRRPGGVPPQSLPTNVFTGALARLRNAGATKGAIFRPAAAETLGTLAPTYVPTKMDMTIELLPMQTRQQVSQGFNLRDYATGNLLRKGFW